VLRVLLVLVLSAVVVFAATSGVTRLVSDDPVPSSTRVTGLAWAGRVFTSEREFTAFLASRGASYDAWAARHPGAAPWMQVQAGTSQRSAGARTAAPKSTPAANRTEDRRAHPTTPPSDAASGGRATAERPAPVGSPTRAAPARLPARAASPPPARPRKRRYHIDAHARGSAAAAANAPPRAVAAGGTSAPGDTLAIEAQPTSAGEIDNPSLVGGFVVVALGLGMMTMIVLVVRFLRGTWNP
jgi:hypothetical protein